ERDAGVAAGGLEDAAAGLELARRLGRLDHREGHAVLDRAGRVLLLELREDAHVRVRRHPRQLDQRRIADGGQGGAPASLETAHAPAPPPPAMAGSTMTVESGATAVSRPLPRRTSSLFT